MHYCPRCFSCFYCLWVLLWLSTIIAKYFKLLLEVGWTHYNAKQWELNRKVMGKGNNILVVNENWFWEFLLIFLYIRKFEGLDAIRVEGSYTKISFFLKVNREGEKWFLAAREQGHCPKKSDDTIRTTYGSKAVSSYLPNLAIYHSQVLTLQLVWKGTWTSKELSLPLKNP